MVHGQWTLSVGTRITGTDSRIVKSLYMNIQKSLKILKCKQITKTNNQPYVQNQKNYNQYYFILWFDCQTQLLFTISFCSFADINNYGDVPDILVLFLFHLNQDKVVSPLTFLCFLWLKFVFIKSRYRLWRPKSCPGGSTSSTSITSSTNPYHI